MVIVSVNGGKSRALGEIESVNIQVGSVKFYHNLQVIDAAEDILILGNDWLSKVRASLDWNDQTLTLWKGNKKVITPVVLSGNSVQEEIQEESETESSDSEEYEDEDLEESAVYFSDFSDEFTLGDLEYNPWINHTPEPESKELTRDETEENPAVFIANVATEEEVPPLNLGPLEDHQQQQFQTLMETYNDICAKSQTEIGRTNITKHRIEIENVVPISQTPYRTNPKNKEFLQTEIAKMEANGIVRKSTSPWASPVVIVDKKGGEKRICIDYRKLNAVTKSDAYPLPRIDDMLESFGQAKWFTTLDLASGYWQVAMHERDIEKTAFVTPFGLYEFLVMPFGLSNAPGTFQRLMNRVLQDFLGDFVAVYLDDVIIYSKGSFEQHMDHLSQVFRALREANLKIKLKKCYFTLPNIHFLGHVVGRDGIKPDPEKIEKVKNYPVPRNLTQLRSALGLFSYYRKFIKDFSRIAKPMTQLLKKGISYIWTEKQQIAFDRLREMLIKAPILSYPDFDKPFVIYTDASGIGLGAVLSQIKDKKEHVIAYASRSLVSAEKNYSVTDQECLAVVWAIKKFQHYLGLKPFTIVTDHSALKWLQTSKMPTGRRARWVMELQQYDFVIKHRPGKTNNNADALSRIEPVFTIEVLEETDNGLGSNYLDTMEHHTHKRRKLENDQIEVMAEEWVTDKNENSDPLVECSYKPQRHGDECVCLKCLRIQKGKFRAISPTIYSCCEQVICECEHPDPIDWNKYIKSYQIETEESDQNGWGNIEREIPTPTQYADDDWGNSYPSDDENNENRQVDNFVHTIAYTFTREEFLNIYRPYIQVKQVIAGQPITRGGSKCDASCDIYNHHLHTYCKMCQKNLPYGTIVHDCKVGLEPGKIHPGMDPKALVNHQWWEEPPAIQMENFIFFTKQFINELRRIYTANYPFDDETLAADLD